MNQLGKLLTLLTRHYSLITLIDGVWPNGIRSKLYYWFYFNRYKTYNIIVIIWNIQMYSDGGPNIFPIKNPTVIDKNKMFISLN